MSATSHDAGDRMEYTDVYVNMVKAAAFHTVRILYNVLRAIIWLLNGTMIEYWSSTKPDHYAQSAQVFSVIYRYKFDLILGQASFEDFILSHENFVHPMYLLRDNCVLYQVTRTHAIFVQVEEGVDIWRGQHGSFLRQAQFLQAKKVITLPLSALELLADEIGPTPAKMIFVQNTARCGSTLLVRMFEETGRCVSLCEPDAVNGICKLARTKKLWDDKTGIRIVRNLVRVMCKPVSSLKEPTLAYILKMTAPSMEAAPFVTKAFPEAYHLFMYRDCIKICQSLAVAAEVMPTLKLVFLMGSVSAKGLQFAVSQMGCSSNEFNVKITGHPYEAGIVLYGITIRKYLQMLQSDIRIYGVRYEDLADDPEYFMEQVLRYCHLPLDLIKPALEATNKDAQKNSALSISNLKTKKKNYRMTPVVAAFMDKYFKDMDVPTESAPVLPNTITHRQPKAKEKAESSQKQPKVEISDRQSEENTEPVKASDISQNTSEEVNNTDENDAQQTPEARPTECSNLPTASGELEWEYDQMQSYVNQMISEPIEQLKYQKFGKAQPALDQSDSSSPEVSAISSGVSASKKVQIVATLTTTEVKSDELVATCTDSKIPEMNRSTSFEIVESNLVTGEKNDTINGLNDVSSVKTPNFIKF